MCLELFESSIEPSPPESMFAEGFSLTASKGVIGCKSRLFFPAIASVSSRGLAIDIQGTFDGCFIETSLSSLIDDC